MSITLDGTNGITTPDVDSDGLTVDTNTLFVDAANNRVGIGTTSPAALLDVNADALIHGATVGRGAGSIATNTALGNGALSSNTTGVDNTATGNNALLNNTTGIGNTAFGFSALRENTTQIRNNAFGFEALRENTTGTENCAFGFGTATFNTTGQGLAAFGHSALRDNTTGNNNVGIGRNAGRSNSPFEVTTQNNRIVMGNNDHTHAYIRIAWTVTSDARDKAEFAPIPYGLDFVNSLQPTEYQFKAGGRDGEADGIRRYGFLAQDVLALEGKDPVITDAEDPENLKLHESYLVPVLVKAIQEQQAIIEALTARITALETAND